MTSPDDPARWPYVRAAHLGLTLGFFVILAVAAWQHDLTNVVLAAFFGVAFLLLHVAVTERHAWPRVARHLATIAATPLVSYVFRAFRVLRRHRRPHRTPR